MKTIAFPCLRLRSWPRRPSGLPRRIGWLAGWLLAAAVLVRPLAAEEDPRWARIESLRAEVARHDELYFRQAAPEITDYEYDLLKLELRRLETEAGLSPTATVGDDRTDRAGLLRHGRPMLSLDKAYDEAEVAEFFARVTALSPGEPVRFVVEPKFDGVAVNVVLERGELRSAATRGNGAAGEDITAQLRTVRGLGYEWAFDPTQPRPERIELRGEVFLSAAAFADLNAARREAGLEPFSHPRNVAAGAVKLADLSAVAARGLSVVFHGWGEVQPAAAAPASVMAFQRWLENLGLPAVAQARFVTPADAAALNAAIAEARRTPFPFPTDGLVLKVDDAALQAALGDGPTAPRWALARKFASPRAETVLRRIGWQVGRTGVLTPVAEFDPVELDGTRLARASLHHAATVRRRDLRVGDTIRIERAGEVIPQVVGVVLERRPADASPTALPTACPSCGGALRIDETDMSRLCPRRVCPEQVVQRLLHFASRAGVGIRGLGPGLAEKLVAAGLVQAVPDLFELDAVRLRSLSGVGERTAAALMAAIEASRAAPLDRVLVGLGLPGVGPAAARVLADRLGGLGDLLEPGGLDERLAGLGPATAGELRAALAQPEIRAELQRLAVQLRSD